MNKPLVSIIMGIHNCEKEIVPCIESIFAQTYTNWELIMCDDGSTDKTWKVAQEFADKFNNIICLSNPKNMKLAYSLNQCLKVAKGKYIARMDSDDLCLPERLEKQVEFLENNPDVDLVGSAIIPYDEHGDKPTRIGVEYPNVRDLVYSSVFFHPTIMMKKECYDALGGYTVSGRTQKGQDIDLWFRFFAHGYKGVNLQTPLLKYHESVGDYKKKRDIKSAIGMMQTRIYGFKINRFPWYLYPYTVQPVISALIPKNIMYKYHNLKR